MNLLRLFHIRPHFFTRWWLVLQALLAGGAQAVALSTSWHAVNGVLAALSLAWLAVLVAQASNVKAAMLAGWLYALAWLAGSVWWLYVSMHQYGGMPALMAAAAVFLLCGGLALIYAIAMALVKKIACASCTGSLNAGAFGAAWLLAELLRGYILTGFPWAATGYAFTDGWLSAYMPWVGVYGVSAIAAWVAAFVAVALWLPVSRRQAVGAFLALLLMVGLCWPLQRDFTRAAGEVKVALLQGNVPQDLKFQRPVIESSLRWYIGAMIEAKIQGADLVVAPETAIAVFPQNIDTNTWEYLLTSFMDGQTAALIGIPMSSPDKGYTNSMIGLVPQQDVYIYDKHHLVPFGEFVPWGFNWFVNMMEIPLGDFGRGPADAPSLAWQQQRFAPNICYEDLFGEELARRFAIESTSPTIMVNASNIAWFGNTIAIPQHLQIARVRALELQRPMVRATNTGATAIIDHRGQIQSMLLPYTQGVLVGNVQGRTGRTPYAYWAGNCGLWPLWACASVLMAFFCLRMRQVARQAV